MDAGHEDRWQKGSSSDATILVFIDNILPAFMIGSNIIPRLILHNQPLLTIFRRCRKYT